MEKVKLKDNSQSYSRMIAGTMRWGQWGAQFSTAEYSDMIAQCLKIGVSTFDHADIYGDYTTEAEFGLALDAMKIKREDIQLITKCGIRMMSTNRPLNKLKSYDHSKTYLINSVEQSLRNLKTEYIDLLLIHRPSPLMRAEEVAEAFSELRASGKVKEFGVSNFTTAQFNLLNRHFELVANQLELSPLYLTSFTDGTLDALQSQKVKPQAWSPLGGAQMFVEHNKLEDTERIMRLQITDEQWFEIWTASTGIEVA